MAIPYKTVYDLLAKGFPDSEIDLIDSAGDMNHYEVTIVSEKFAGLSLIKQHKMVYDAIGSEMGKELHALKINTKVK